MFLIFIYKNINILEQKGVDDASDAKIKHCKELGSEKLPHTGTFLSSSSKAPLRKGTHYAILLLFRRLHTLLEQMTFVQKAGKCN